MQIPIMWRIEEPRQLNLWHFIHEITEIETKLSGIRTPRWLVEGLAQYTAYIYYYQYHTNWLKYVEEHYSENIPVSKDAMLDWGYAGLSLDNGIAHGSLQDALKWGVGQHSTSMEKSLYGAVLRVFVDSFYGILLPREIMGMAREGSEGIERIRRQLRFGVE